MSYVKFLEWTFLCGIRVRFYLSTTDVSKAKSSMVEALDVTEVTLQFGKKEQREIRVMPRRRANLEKSKMSGSHEILGARGREESGASRV